MGICKRRNWKRCEIQENGKRYVERKVKNVYFRSW